MGCQRKLVLRKPLCVLRSQALKLLTMLKGQHVQRSCEGKMFDYWEQVSVLGAQRETGNGVGQNCGGSEATLLDTLGCSYAVGLYLESNTDPLISMGCDVGTLTPMRLDQLGGYTCRQEMGGWTTQRPFRPQCRLSTPLEAGHRGGSSRGWGHIY